MIQTADATAPAPASPAASPRFVHAPYVSRVDYTPAQARADEQLNAIRRLAGEMALSLHYTDPAHVARLVTHLDRVLDELTQADGAQGVIHAYRGVQLASAQ